MSSLGDIIVDALQELLRVLFTPIRSVIETHGDALVRTIVGTPAPDVIFSRPANGSWPGLYDYYWETMIPLALFVWGLSVALVIFLESMSHVFSGYHRSKLKRRAFSGLLGILAWWWVAALSLQFVDSLASFLVPSLGDIALFDTLSFGAMGVLGLALTLSADLLLFVLIGLIYFVRQMALYLYVLLMPLLIALWIPGIGPLSLVSGLMKRLARFYVPFLFMTVPVALLFRVGAVLGESVSLSAGGLGRWLTALVVPILAIVLPLVLFWQAGTLFSMTDKMSRRASTRQMRQRGGKIQDVGTRAEHTSRNFTRGIRGRGAVESDGTKRFGSGESRANRRGLQVRSQAENAVTGLRGRVGTFRESTRWDGTDESTQRDSESETDASTEADAEQGSEVTGRTSQSGLTPTGGLSGTRGSSNTSSSTDTAQSNTPPNPQDTPSESTDSRPDSTADTENQSSETQQTRQNPTDRTADVDPEDADTGSSEQADFTDHATATSRPDTTERPDEPVTDNAENEMTDSDSASFDITDGEENNEDEDTEDSTDREL